MKKRLVMMSTAVLMAGVLASCGAKTEKKAESSTAKETSKAAEESGKETEKASAGGTLSIVATSEDYKKLFDEFTKDTGIQTELLSKSSGDVLNQLKAGGTPIADLWFGGGIDAFMSAKDNGLLEKIDLDSANDFATGYVDPDHYWYTKGVTVVGFIVNDELLKSKNLEAPKTWEDLTNASYKDEVLMSNPAVSGTNYGVVNAMLQKKGEDEGWKYFTALNENVKYYSKRGGDPREKTAQGEVAIGITPMDKKTEKLATENNCSLVYPEDGIPYVPEGVAVFKGASNVEQAKEFLNWLYNSEDNLKELAEIDGKNTIKVVLPKLSGVELSFDTGKLMKEDLSLFGSQRDSILKKWETLAGSKNEA
mgnify:CR=1 FL=1